MFTINSRLSRPPILFNEMAYKNYNLLQLEIYTYVTHMTTYLKVYVYGKKYLPFVRKSLGFRDPSPYFKFLHWFLRVEL